MEGMQDLFGNKTATTAFQQQYQKIVAEVLQDKEVQQFLQEHQDEIPQENLVKSYSALLEYIQQRDARIQGVETYIKGMEPLLRVNQGFVEVVYRPTQEFIQKQQQQDLTNRIHAINMPKNLLQVTLNSLDITKERQETFQASLQFINELSAKPNEFHRAIYLVGSFGVGKTYFLAAIANELAQLGFETTLVHVPTLSSELKSAIGANRLEEKVEFLKTSPILMLDDIGAESNSAWFRDEILMIVLEYRMMQELPTFLSGESLYLIQHSSEYEDPLTCGNSDISSLYGVRLNLIPQNVWGDMIGDFWFFDLDRQRKVLLMSYSGSGCLVEDPDAVAKWWVGACRLMLMVERTPGESMW